MRWFLGLIGVGALLIWLLVEPERDSSRPNAAETAASKQTDVTVSSKAVLPVASNPSVAQNKLIRMESENIPNALPVEHQTPIEEKNDSRAKLKDFLMKDAGGEPVKLSQSDATKTCSQIGMRLPTIRELARLAQTRGAKGILGVDEIGDRNLIEGYILVTPTNPAGNRDDFYYSPSGYLDPDPKARDQIFWSSSACMGCEIPGGGNSAYVFDGSNGSVQNHYSYISFAVRCLGKSN